RWKIGVWKQQGRFGNDACRGAASTQGDGFKRRRRAGRLWLAPVTNVHNVCFVRTAAATDDRPRFAHPTRGGAIHAEGGGRQRIVISEPAEQLHIRSFWALELDLALMLALAAAAL
ncbi:hypothetical protein H4R99_008473, partial [Coemansia sp. RSA 1722]